MTIISAQDFDRSQILADSMMQTLVEIELKMRAAHQTHMGYPYNLSFESAVSAGTRGSWLADASLGLR